MKTVLTLLGVLLTLALPAQAQIARDAAAVSAGEITAFTLTIAHDCGSGSNRMLIAAFYTNDATDISAATYAGVALGTPVMATGNKTRLYMLFAPATGSNNLVFTNTNFHYMSAVVKCYTGVNQSNTVDSSGSGTANATSLTVSSTTVADNCWQFYAVLSTTATASSAGTGSSLVGSQSDGITQSLVLFDSNAALTPAGAHSMQATLGSAVNWEGALASFAPAGGGGGPIVAPRGSLGLMGTGR